MKKFYAVLTLTLGLILCASVSSVSALTVSPAKVEIAGDPGTTLNGVIKLYNEKDNSQTFYTSFENFEPSDDSGTPRFVGAENGLATWMSTTPSLDLGARQRTEVPFSISIPADAEPGGYFAAIFFGTQPPAEEGGTLSIGGRLGILILLRVNGDIPEAGGLLEYDTIDGQFFYDMPPVEFEYRFSNDGGDRIVPRGDVEITNTFGFVRKTLDANPGEGSILPSSARRFNVSWTTEDESPTGFFNKASSQWRNFHFGWYTAELNLGWGFTNQVTSEKVSMLIIPWQLLIVVIVGLVILRFLLKFILSRYKASLIREIQKQESSE